MITYFLIGFIIMILWDDPIKNIAIITMWPFAIIRAMWKGLVDDPYDN